MQLGQHKQVCALGLVLRYLGESLHQRQSIIHVWIRLLFDFAKLRLNLLHHVFLDRVLGVSACRSLGSALAWRLVEHTLELGTLDQLVSNFKRFDTEKKVLGAVFHCQTLQI